MVSLRSTVRTELLYVPHALVCICLSLGLTPAAVELAPAGEATLEESNCAAAATSPPAPSGSGGFSRQYLRGLACAVYVGVANGSFLVSTA